MLKNAYGTNQEHLEPDVISDIPIPLPKDKAVITEIGDKVIESIAELEKSIENAAVATRHLDELLAAPKTVS